MRGRWQQRPTLDLFLAFWRPIADARLRLHPVVAGYPWVLSDKRFLSSAIPAVFLALCLGQFRRAVSQRGREPEEVQKRFVRL